MKKSISAVVAILLCLGTSPAAAQDVVSTPGPEDITWAQFADMNLQESSTYIDTPAPSSRLTRLAVGSCALNTGNIYMRTSGSIYPYGAMGIKPKTTCSVPMVSISHSTKIYKTVWWGLQLVHTAPLSNNSGQVSLETTNIEVVCADYRRTEFYAYVNSTGVFPGGATGSSNAWQSGFLGCGTNP